MQPLKFFKHFKTNEEFREFMQLIDADIKIADVFNVPEPIFLEFEITARFWSLSEIMRVTGSALDYFRKYCNNKDEELKIPGEEPQP